MGLEREIREFDRQIREARCALTAAMTLEDKLAAQRQIRMEALIPSDFQPMPIRDIDIWLYLWVYCFHENHD
ncbi:MAG: hypothetical protein ACRER9_03030 [Gammaproteobacteria bacterium]